MIKVNTSSVISPEIDELRGVNLITSVTPAISPTVAPEVVIEPVTPVTPYTPAVAPEVVVEPVTPVDPATPQKKTNNNKYVLLLGLAALFLLRK